MLLAATVIAEAPRAMAFGVDVCFNDPTVESQILRNCIGVQQMCRRQPLPPAREVRCRVRATADSLSGLSGGNAIIGGRSLVHSDAAYLMAQLLGFSPWQAYQIMIYAEATDQSTYEPSDQKGRLMLDAQVIQACYESDMTDSFSCLGITPKLNGLYKFNDTTGGQLLHLHARYSPDHSPAGPDMEPLLQPTEAPPVTPFPTDYTSEENAHQEILINNLRAWAFDQRDDLCVSGVTADLMDPLSPCVTEGTLNFPMHFFGFAIAAAVPFQAELGRFIVDDLDGRRVESSSEQFAAYIPHDLRMAKMGIYLHSLADRISHHKCTDVSWFQQTSTTAFDSVFPALDCGQGGHFLWHAWEQGTDQARIREQEFRTMEVALDVVWDELATRANELGLTPTATPNKASVIADLVSILGIYDAEQRLNTFVDYLESSGAVSLPGHGVYEETTLDDWLQAFAVDESVM